ncbi:hypothetical protein [Sphingomonas sanguinis]|nr:hypothetical protein [Sphingomonas sanguinis]
MVETIRKYFAPILALNRRVSIGGGGLALILIGESALSFIRPLA